MTSTDNNIQIQVVPNLLTPQQISEMEREHQEWIEEQEFEEEFDRQRAEYFSN